MTRKKGVSFGFLMIALAFLCLLVPGRPFAQEDLIQRPKLFQENYQLITDSDLYCSFYMLEQGKPLPDTRIIGAEREREKSQFSDADTVYLSKGSVDGLEIGQLFQVVGVREKVGVYGHVAERHARARVVRLEDHLATARLERTCGPVRVGDYLLPFEEEEGEIGKDKGFGDMDPNASKKGKVIYIENDFHIAGTSQWALIDLGRQHCVQIGDQINVFFQPRKDLPREAIGSAIIIDVRGATSTIKILSCRDVVQIGSEVQVNAPR